jgi:hypothetical protein
MSEAEYNRLLDAVRTAIAPVPGENTMAHFRMPASPRRAANDNEGAWPMIPFPDGWNAVC